jgi:hypothetical protein
LGVFGHQNDIQLITVASQALHMSQLSRGGMEGDWRVKKAKVKTTLVWRVVLTK